MTLGLTTPQAAHPLAAWRLWALVCLLALLGLGEARAQTVAEGGDIYRAPGYACSGCHFSNLSPDSTNVYAGFGAADNHIFASNNWLYLKAIRDYTGPLPSSDPSYVVPTYNGLEYNKAASMTIYIGGTSDVDLKSLALFIGQYQRPKAPDINVAVTQNTAKVIDLYPYIPTDGSSGVPDPAGTWFNTVSGPSKGSVAITSVTAGPQYNITYTPNAGATGSDSFTYTLTNLAGTSTSSGTVTIYILAAEPAITSTTPPAGSTFQAYSGYTLTASNTSGSTSVSFSLVNAVSSPLPPGLSLSGTSITGTPTQNGIFDTNIKLTVDFSGVIVESTATLRFTIGYTALSATDASMTVALNTSGSLDLRPYISPSGADVSGVAVVTRPLHGTVSTSGTTVTYTPARDYFGSDEFTYQGLGSDGTTVLQRTVPAKKVLVTVTGRPNPLADPEVTAAIAAQQTTATLFTQAQVSNFMGRMENLHGRLGGPGSPAPAGAGSGPPATSNTAPNPSLNPIGAAALAQNNTSTSDESAVLADRGGAYAPAATAKSVEQSLSGQYATLRGPEGGATSSTYPPLAGQGSRETSAAHAVAALKATLSQSDSATARAAGQVIGLVQALSQGSGTVQLNMSSDAGKTPRLGLAGSAIGVLGGLEYWISGGIQFSKKAIGSGIAFSTSGISMGADKRLTDSLIAGVGLGFGRESTDIGTDGSGNKSTGNTLMLYGSYAPAPKWYVDGLLGYGRYAFDGKRWVDPIDTFAINERTATAVFASLATGYEWRVPGLNAAPYLRMDLSEMRIGSATETGAGLYNLIYAADDTRSQSLSLGLRGQLARSLGSAWAMPRARIELAHRFDGAPTTRLAYADQPNNLFTVSGSDAKRNSLMLGLGTDFLFKSGLRFSVDYQLQYAARDQSSQGIFFMLRQSLDGRGPETRHLQDFELAPWLNGINFDTSVMYDDNVTRASVPADVLSDTVYRADFSRGWKGGEYAKTRHAITLNWGGERWANYHGLDRLYASVDAKWQYRASGAFAEPIWSVVGRGAVENFGSDLRDGVRLGAGGAVWLPLTHRIEMNASLMREARNAKSAVFDGQNAVLRAGLDYNMLSSSVAYVEGEWRRGDLTSTGRPSLSNLAIARSFVSDDAFTGGSLTAYRFDGRSSLYTIGLYVPLGGRDALDISWRRVNAAPDVVPITGPIRYRVNQLSIVYQQNF